MKKEEFLYTVALMGLADFIYKGRQASKKAISWMNEQELLAYNIGWKYGKENF